MMEYENQNDQEQDHLPAISNGRRLAYGLGSAVPLTVAASTFGHLGSTGIIVGVIGALGMASFGPDLVESLKEKARGALPRALGVTGPHQALGTTGNEWLDRAFGRNYEEEEPGPLSAIEADRRGSRRPEYPPEDEDVLEFGEEDDDTEAEDGTDPVEAVRGKAEGHLLLPQAPTFREMCHLIEAHRLVLCWTTRGPLYGTIKDLLSMVIIGKPGRGKTTALMYYVAMLLKANAEVHVWDMHGSMSELDGAFPRLHYTDEPEDIPASIAALRIELGERRKLYKKDKSTRHPLLLLVDELPVIGEYNKALVKKGVEENQTPVKLISDFVLQARKWNCYFIGAGQSTDADILPTRVTENLSSRIVFYSSNRRATMAGIDLETAKKFLPSLKPDTVQGRMIFDCSRLSEPLLGAIPYLTIADIQQFLGVSSQEQRPMTPQPDVVFSEPAPKRLEDLTLDDLLAIIGRMKDVDPQDSRYGGQQPEPPEDEEKDEEEEEEEEESLDEKALRVYREGHSSLDAFAAAMDIGRDKSATRALWQRTKFRANALAG